MTRTIAHPHLVDLVGQVRSLLAGDFQDDLERVEAIHSYLEQWARTFDLASTSSYLSTMHGSFLSAARRGIPGEGFDLERSLRSLQLNLDYYAPRLHLCLP